MSQDDDSVFAPDDGTPLHALAELRRAMGDRYDKASGEVLHAVDRAHSAIIQADSAKTAQEEMRHLIRALATASEMFILTPKKIQETYRDALEGLQRQVETLAAAIPVMPPTPDQLAARIEATTARVNGLLSHCEVAAANLEQGLTAQIRTMIEQLRRASADVAWEARAAAVARRRHDLWLLAVGLALGLLLGAYVWKSAPPARRSRLDVRPNQSESSCPSPCRSPGPLTTGLSGIMPMRPVSGGAWVTVVSMLMSSGSELDSGSTSAEVNAVLVEGRWGSATAPRCTGGVPAPDRVLVARGYSLERIEGWPGAVVIGFTEHRSGGPRVGLGCSLPRAHDLVEAHQAVFARRLRALRIGLT